MYTPDNRDVVVKCDIAPAHTAGASTPIVLASDGGLLLCYEIAPVNEAIAAITFEGAVAHYFGPPNDEAMAGHPLASRGLAPYGTFEVLSSSWLRSLRDMNSVHRFDDPNRFSKLRHFVFTFHDSIFETVAEVVETLNIVPRSADAVSRLILEHLARFGHSQSVRTS